MVSKCFFSLYLIHSKDSKKEKEKKKRFKKKKNECHIKKGLYRQQSPLDIIGVPEKEKKKKEEELNQERAG